MAGKKFTLVCGQVKFFLTLPPRCPAWLGHEITDAGEWSSLTGERQYLLACAMTHLAYPGVEFVEWMQVADLLGAAMLDRAGAGATKTEQP